MPPAASGWIRAQATPRAGPSTRPSHSDGTERRRDGAGAQRDMRTTPTLPLRPRLSTPRAARSDARAASSTDAGAHASATACHRGPPSDAQDTPSGGPTPPRMSPSDAPPTPTFPWQQGWSERLPRYRELAKMTPAPAGPATPQCSARLQRKRDPFADVEQVWRDAVDTPSMPRTKRVRPLSTQTTLESFLLAAPRADEGGATSLPSSPASSTSSVPGEEPDELAPAARRWLGLDHVRDGAVGRAGVVPVAFVELFTALVQIADDVAAPLLLELVALDARLDRTRQALARGLALGHDRASPDRAGGSTDAAFLAERGKSCGGADRRAPGSPMGRDAAHAARPPQPMSTARSDGTGAATPIILLRSEEPLPQFCVPLPLPPPDTDTSALRLAALRILTGGTMAEATQPLTYSEQLKQVTIQGWRLNMLELVQVQGGSAGPEDDEVALGLLLTDEHTCGALEHGDEIVVRLARGHTLADLQLPPLPADYDFAAAAQHPHSAAAPTTYTIARPTEPSSHSSSVQAHPTTNFHAYSYPDYRNGYRVVVAQGVHNGVGYRGTPAAAPRTVPAAPDASRAVQTHQLAALMSMARANSAAGDEARARLAALGVAPPKPARARAEKPRKKAALPGTALVIGPGVQGVAGERVSGTPNAMRVPQAPAPGGAPPVVTTAALAPETALPPAPAPEAARRAARTGMPPVPQAPAPLHRAARTRPPPLQTSGAALRSPGASGPTSPLYHSLGGDLRSLSAPRAKKKVPKSRGAQAMHLLRAVRGPTSPRTARLFAPLYAQGSLAGGAPQRTITGRASPRHATRGEQRTPSAPVRAVRNDAPTAALPVRRAVTQPPAATGGAGEADAPADGAAAAPKQRHLSTGEAMRLLFSQGLTEARDQGAPSESTKAAMAQSTLPKTGHGARKSRHLFSFGSRKTKDTVVDHAAETDADAVPEPAPPAAYTPPLPPTPAQGQCPAPAAGTPEGSAALPASAPAARPQGSVFQEHVGALPPAALARKKTFPAAHAEGPGLARAATVAAGVPPGTRAPRAPSSAPVTPARAGSWGTVHPGAAPAISMAGMPLHTRTASDVSGALVAARGPSSPVAARVPAPPVATEPVREAPATELVREAPVAQPLPAYLQHTTLAELGAPVRAPAAQPAADTPPTALAAPDAQPNTVLHTQPAPAAVPADALPPAREGPHGEAGLAAGVEDLHLDKALPHQPRTKDDWGERLREAVSAPIDLSASHAPAKHEHGEPLGERLLEAVSAQVDLSDEPSTHGAAARADSPEPAGAGAPGAKDAAAADADGAEPAEPALSRAELRYLEVQRELAEERARQDRAERHRIERLVRRQNGARRADVPPSAEEVAQAEYERFREAERLAQVEAEAKLAHAQREALEQRVLEDRRAELAAEQAARAQEARYLAAEQAAQAEFAAEQARLVERREQLAAEQARLAAEQRALEAQWAAHQRRLADGA
ncbi:hypothetical protein MBRA1_002734 [Malassezia brasiliensis]|uniref:Uncharacterized protein n=1 Tax=Malassezia brasiliensis TaxID=1821822 RepID=A0AAF0ITN5_9BASI|nr:hypothetical protein MBRA1_002734 [Malassezia brasiliensis]